MILGLFYETSERLEMDSVRYGLVDDLPRHCTCLCIGNARCCTVVVAMDCGNVFGGEVVVVKYNVCSPRGDPDGVT